MGSREQSAIPNKHAPVYTIGVTAELIGVSVASLRKYEDAHLLLPARTESNHRRYSQQDLEILRCIREMIEDYGVGINGIGRLLALIPCWEIKDCAPEEREQCDAYYNEELPCWSAQIKQGICAETECRLCEVYDSASNLSHLKTVIKQYFDTKRSN